MIYVLDTNSFSVFKYFYQSRFPSFWKQLDALVASEGLISVREVLKELESSSDSDFVYKWAKSKKDIFRIPTSEESLFIQEIFKIPHFQYLVEPKKMLKGGSVADPFLIAAAKLNQGCVVTEEVLKPNASKIPNVCQHFKIECTNLEGFMQREGWEF